jgi:hypothetical protein
MAPALMSPAQRAAERDERIAAALDDFLRQCRLGATLPVEEYLTQFPALQPELGLLLHEALAEEGHPAPRYRGGLEKIPNYRRLGAIGQGSYGTVVLYEHEHNPGHYRAFKIVPKVNPGHRTEVEGARTVFNLAEKDEELRDFCVLPLEAPGEEADFFYYPMAPAQDFSGQPRIAEATYVPTTLQVIICAPTPPAPTLILEIMIDLCLGLEKLHRLGVLHRDLKPSNVLLQGRWKFGDLGQVIRHDRDNGLGGTLVYQEGAAVPPGDANRDLIPLGKIMYQLLSGRPLTDEKAWQEFLAGTPSRPDMPLHGRLSAIARKACLGQYRHVGEMLAELHRARPRPWPRPAPFVVAAALAALLLLTVGGAELLRLLRPHPGPVGSQEPPAPPALKGKIDVKVLRKDTRSGEEQELWLHQRGVAPLRKGDRPRIFVEMDRAAYLYVVWLESTGNVVPIYPWHPKQGWATSRNGEERVARLTIPDESESLPLEASPSGLEAILVLAREEPLPPGEDQKLAALFKELPKQGRMPRLDVADWLENGRLTPEGPNRGAPKFRENEDHPVAHLQRFLRERLRPLFPYTRAVCYGFEGE